MSDHQLKSIIERILRLHAEEDERKADRREVYAEAKLAGYDKTALGSAVATIRKREKLSENVIAERESIVDLYVAAYDGPSRAHTHERIQFAGRATSLSGIAVGKSPDAQAPEIEHVDRSASAQPHSANGGPAILSKAGDAGTGQAVCIEIGQPSEAGIGSAVRAGAPEIDPVDEAVSARNRADTLRRAGIEAA